MLNAELDYILTSLLIPYQFVLKFVLTDELVIPIRYPNISCPQTLHIKRRRKQYRSASCQREQDTRGSKEGGQKAESSSSDMAVNIIREYCTEHGSTKDLQAQSPKLESPCIAQKIISFAEFR